MRTIDDIPVKNAFPCIYWHTGYMFSAEEPRNLYVGSRSVFMEMQQGAKKWHLLDCDGRYYDITGWEEIKPFGGISLWFERLIGQAFMVPILTNERQLTLDDFKATLLSVAEERFRHDIEPYALQDISDGLPHATTYLEAVRVAIKGT
jgi:hypothetical protein